MPIIYSYPLINTVKDSDQFIISVAPTDSEDTFETRNVTYETLRDSILAGSTSGTVESITFVAPLTGGTITETGSVSLPQANSSTDGYLSSTDWTAFNAKQDLSEKGQANGYAPLNAFTKIDVQYLPDSFVGAVVYQGTWNAGTNTPTLPAPDPNNKGYYYVVSDPGTYLGITYGIGDWVISNGTAWEKVDNSQSVTSVNGQQGVVVLTTSDIAEGTNLYYTDARVALAPAVVANTAKVSFPGFGTTAGTALEGDTFIPPEYTNADVDAHLNVSTAQLDQVLSWNGVDYNWVNQSSGGSGSVTEITTSGGLTGGPITSTGDISIDPTGTIGAGTYGSTFSSVKINQIEVDAYGRIVSISTGSTGSGSGTMSSFNVTNGTTSGVMSDGGTFQITGSSGTSVSLGGSGNFSSFVVTNTDRGSSQNIYKNFRADTGGTATANVNNDTLVIAGGTNIETNRNGDVITINATGGNTDTTYSYASAQSTNDVDLTLTGSDASTNTVKLVAGSNVTLTDNGSNQVTIDAATGTGVGGSGIQNYIPIWSTTSTIGNSAIFQDGTNIGINTTSINANSALHVNGNLRVENTTTAASFYRERSSTTGTSQTVQIVTYTNSGAIQDDFGGGVEFFLVDPAINPAPAARMYAVRNGGDSTGTLRFWTGLNGGVNTLNMVSTGQLELPGYGGGSFPGTATKSLAVNAGGDVIEIDVATSNVQSDWNVTSGAAEILNKPTDLVSGTTQSQTAVTQIRTLTSAEYQAITPAADILYIIV